VNEPILSKLADIFGSIIKPNHLMILIAVISGPVLFDIFSLPKTLKIEEDVNEYRFWIALSFFSCAGLQLIGLSTSVLSWLWRFAKRKGKNFSASRVKVSSKAMIILELLDARRPDVTRLRREHPAVRELRLNQLIYTHSFFENDVVPYDLTEAGLIVLAHGGGAASSLDDAALMNFLVEVTGDTDLSSRIP
jgi:hypothetical protein